MAEGRTCQNMERTDWARTTHVLETAEGGTCQYMKRNRQSEAHSLSGDSRGRGLSGHGKKPTERGTITFWRRQREGLVRTWKETDRARPTHILETAEEGTCQDTERNRSSEGHSRPGDGRGRELSGYGKKTERGPLTSWRWQREGLVRTRKETDRPRTTHILETAEGGICQNTERNRLSEAHSRSRDGRGRNLSGHRKKPTEGGTLTNWRRQREGFVRIRKEIG